MAFDSDKSPGDLIRSQDWDDFVNFSKNTSGNARLKYLESGGTKWVDLTDSGDTTLHIHDSRYYTETESISLFAASSSVSRALLDSISSNLDTRLDSIFNYSSNARRLYAGSSQVNRTLINLISSNLDSRIDSLYNWSSNGLNKYGASSHTHDSRYFTESESLSSFAGSSNYQTHKTTYTSYLITGHLKSRDYGNISSNAKFGQNFSLSGGKYTWSYKSIIDSGTKWYSAYKSAQSLKTHAQQAIISSQYIKDYIASSTIKTNFAGSSNIRFRFPGSSSLLAKYNASGKIAGLPVSKINTPGSAKVLKWDVSNAYWSAQSDLTGGGGGGTSSWVYLNASTGLTPWSDNTRAVSGQGSTLSLSVIGYSNISSNAKKGYASGQIVKDLFDHTLYVQSSSTSFFNSELDLTTLLNDNYAGSSQINRNLLNSISSNIDSRIDSLFNWSSNKSLYANSSNIRFRFVASSIAIGRFANSSNYSSHKSNANAHHSQSHDIASHTWANDWMIIYSNGTGLVELPFNDQSGKYLKSNGESALSWGDVYDSEGDLTSLLNDNYPGSSQINRAILNSISSNLDTRIDSLFNFSSNKSIYAGSSNVRFRFPGSSSALTKYLASSAFKRNGWNSSTWKNSSIVWDSTLLAWKPKKSGSSSADVAWSGASGYYRVSSIAFKSGISEINMLEDVDTQTTAPSRDQVLKWNGTNWVPAAYNATFVFTIASFSDGETTTQLIGTGTWKAQSAMTCTATYNNGPPTTTWITHAYNGTNYGKSGSCGEMTAGSSYLNGTNSTKAISYPAAKDYYVRFRLSAQAGTDTDTETETAVTFRNYIYYGTLTKNKSISEADIESLTGTLTHGGTPVGSYSINAGAGQYLVLSYPASYTNIPSGSDYESDGGTGFLFNSKACAFSGHAYVSVTNSAGYTENYKVFASNLPNLGNSTLVTTTTTATINTIYYGKTSTATGYTESDVEGLSQSSTTNTYDSVVWTTITAGVGEFLLFCFPKRWGEKGTAYTFYDNATGFEAAFLAAETVSVTNSNGWTEDFYVYRSENANLGAVTIRTD